MLRVGAAVAVILGAVAGLAVFVSGVGNKTDGFSASQTVQAFEEAGITLGVETTLAGSRERFEPTSEPFASVGPLPAVFDVVVFPGVGAARRYVSMLPSTAGVLRRANVVVEGDRRDRHFIPYLREILARIGVPPTQVV